MSTAESEVIQSESDVNGMSVELAKVGTALAEYSKVDAGLAELRKAYAGVLFEVAKATGMEAARKARAAIREPRYKVEEIRKSAKAPLLALGRTIDGEAKRITAALMDLEMPISLQIETEEQRRETERKEKAAAEAARVGEIQRRLARIQALTDVYTAAVAPERLADVIGQLEAGLAFDYQEFADVAEASRQAAIAALRERHIEATERVEREAREAAERAAEQARQDAEREIAEIKARVAREAEDRRLEDERKALAAALANMRRQAQIDERIRALAGPAHLTATDSPDLISLKIATLADAVLLEADYGERLSEAHHARKAGVERLQGLWKAALDHKNEQARLAAQRAEQEAREEAQRQAQADLQRRQREQEAAEAERKWLAEQEAARNAEAERLAREEAERAEAARIAEAKRKAEIVEQLARMTAEDIVRWIASELGCDWQIVAARLAEIPREDWLALTHQGQQP